MLCQLLDPADPMGRDWCLLAVQLEMTDKVPKLDGGSSHESKKVCSQTARVLDEWEQNASSTIGKFISTNFFFYMIKYYKNIVFSFFEKNKIRRI